MVKAAVKNVVWEVKGTNEKACVKDIESNNRIVVNEYLKTMFRQRYGCKASIKIDGYDNFEKYLTENCQDKQYIEENLRDIIDDNMLEAEHTTTGIDLEIETDMESILVNYNVICGNTSIDIEETFRISSI